jgi:hypothetical protein
MEVSIWSNSNLLQIWFLSSLKQSPGPYMSASCHCLWRTPRDTTRPCSDVQSHLSHQVLSPRRWAPCCILYKPSNGTTILTTTFFFFLLSRVDHFLLYHCRHPRARWQPNSAPLHHHQALELLRVSASILHHSTMSLENRWAIDNVTFPRWPVNSATNTTIIGSSPPVSLLSVFLSPEKLRQFAHFNDPFSLPRGCQTIGFLCRCPPPSLGHRWQLYLEHPSLSFLDSELWDSPGEA